MAFVLDASVAGPWALADEPSEAAKRIATRMVIEEAIVPPLWWYEVRNLLVVCSGEAESKSPTRIISSPVLIRTPSKLTPK